MLEQTAVVLFYCLAVLVAVVLVSLVVTLWNYKKGRGTWASLVLLISGILTLIGGVACAFYFFPYNLKYQTWEPQEKMVRTVQFDIQGAGTNRYADGGLKITFADGTYVFTDDFRLAVAEPGRPLKMLCKPEFVSGNVDKMRCKAPTGG